MNQPETKQHGNTGNQHRRTSGVPRIVDHGRFHDSDRNPRRRVADLRAAIKHELVVNGSKITITQEAAIAAILRAEGAILLLMKQRATAAELTLAEKRQIERNIVSVARRNCVPSPSWACRRPQQAGPTIRGPHWIPVRGQPPPATEGGHQ